MRQKLTKLCKRLIDFVKGVTLIEIFVTVCIIAIIIGLKSCADKHDPGYVVTDRKTGECFLFRDAEWACNGCHRAPEPDDVFFYRKGNGEIRGFGHAKYMVESHLIPPEYSRHCPKQ